MERFVDLFEDCTSQGTKIKTDEYHETGKYVIIDQGQNDIAGYTDEVDGVYEDVPAIIFGDHTRVIKYIDTPFFLGADGVKLLKCKKENANYKYLYYALKNASIPDTGYNRHFKWLKEIEIEYPDSIKQQKIVDVLDKVTGIVKDRQSQLEELDHLVKSRFIEMFGDYKINSKGFEQYTGKELFKFSSGKFLPEYKRLETGIPVYGGNGIAWFTDTPLIECPTIVIGRVGALCGNIHLVTEPAWITDNAIFLKELNTNRFTLVFLAELMDLMDFHQYADFSGQPKITQKPLEMQAYIVPPIEMQHNFTLFVRQVRIAKAAVQKSINELQLLFDSLMQKYFGQ